MMIRIISWNVRRLNRFGKRESIKNMIHSWKADVYCFHETKIEGEIRELVRELWAYRWVKFAQLKASGTRGYPYHVGR